MLFSFSDPRTQKQNHRAILLLTLSAAGLANRNRTPNPGMALGLDAGDALFLQHHQALNLRQ